MDTTTKTSEKQETRYATELDGKISLELTMIIVKSFFGAGKGYILEKEEHTLGEIIFHLNNQKFSPCKIVIDTRVFKQEVKWGENSSPTSIVGMIVTEIDFIADSEDTAKQLKDDFICFIKDAVDTLKLPKAIGYIFGSNAVNN